jgi:hypothetical protein
LRRPAIRRFLFRRLPPFDRVLLVESGSRELLERFLPWLYGAHPSARVDLVTCYAGVPSAFRSDGGEVFRTYEHVGGGARRRLYEVLQERHYNIICIICSDEPVMTKWKWALTWNVPAKLLILNENGDYFWADRGQFGTICHFIAVRAGLSGAEAVPTIARLLLFPFTLLYLLVYAAAVHLRRRLRLRFRHS